MSKRLHPQAFLPIGVLAIAAFLLPSATSAATFYIDPSAASKGNGTSARPFNNWNLVSFQPGNTYLQKAGVDSDAKCNTLGRSGTPRKDWIFPPSSPPSAVFR